MTNLPIKIIFGGAGFMNKDKFKTAEDAQPFFDVLDKQGITHIDTAHLYGNSETFLGEVEAGNKFTFDTKWLGGWTPGSATKEYITRSAGESLQKLGVKKLDIFYIHAPDTKTPFAETLEGVNEVYQKGTFTRFGLSNFTPAQVQEVYDICKDKGYVLPTVYQGNYAAVTRIPEVELFPVLRKLDIAFYAYSPLVGGLLTKTADEIKEGAGRFGGQGPYRAMYNKPKYLEMLSEWEAAAKEEGIGRAELGFRWITYHSALDASGKKGDGLVVGASRPEQLDNTIEAIRKGPLSDKAVKRIEKIWELVKDEAPIDNFAQ